MARMATKRHCMNVYKSKLLRFPSVGFYMSSLYFTLLCTHFKGSLDDKAVRLAQLVFGHLKNKFEMYLIFKQR